MSRRYGYRTEGKPRREGLFRPALERLEDRCLLNADPLNLVAGSVAPIERILVAYENGQTEVVDLNGADLAATLESYKTTEGVAYAEPDYTVGITVIPNDSRFSQLYGQHNTGQSIIGTAGLADRDIDAVEAWDQFGSRKGSTSIVVGIIDSGIDYTHEDLYLNVWINQEEIPTAIRSRLTDVDADGVITFWDLNNSVNIGAGKITDLNGNNRIDAGDILKPIAQGGWADGVDQDAFTTRGITYRYVDDLVGWNFVNNTNNPFDDNGHGTHVAGTVGAIGNNGVGVTGVNWVSQLAALKFLSASGSGSTSAAAAAIDYAVGNRMRVTNNSWGGGGYSTTLEAAIRNARDNNQIFVAAAGNESSNNDSVASYPTNYNLANVISVAATDNRDTLAGFSNYGASTVDLAAPGVYILSTTPSNSTNPNGNYAYYSGTSMAAPHVAGAAALLLARNSSLSYSQVISQLNGNVDPVSGLTGKVVTAGRLNVHRAIINSAPPPVDAAGARVVTASILGTQTSVTGLQVTFNEDINSNTFTTADITELTGFATLPTITIQRVNARTYNLLFSTAQSRVGNYSLTIGPAINDLAGNAMNQNQNGVNGETGSGGDAARVTFSVVSPASTFTNSTAAAIRDFQTTRSSIVISNQNVTITDLNVQVNLTHTYTGDLRLQLRGPDGTLVRLFNYRGGSGDNLTGTVFDDQASTAISAGRAPFQGSFRPEVALSGFNGKSLNGTWTLEVYDAAGGDIGTLTSWSLIVTGSSNGGTVSRREFLTEPFDPVSSSFTPDRSVERVWTAEVHPNGTESPDHPSLAFAILSDSTNPSTMRQTPSTPRSEETPTETFTDFEGQSEFEVRTLAAAEVWSSDPEAPTDEPATDQLFAEMVESIVEE